jgi:hypothetical protein
VERLTEKALSTNDKKPSKGQQQPEDFLKETV